jgi:uncharacterized membrane protein
MKLGRLNALSDGIFAIAVTLLVLELKIPEIDHATNNELWKSLTKESIIFLSYLMSFMALYVYWRAHSFIMSLVHENITVWLSNLNAIFLLFVALLPFSTAILGRYHYLSLGICVYALNIIFIGLLLFMIRRYIEYSGNVQHTSVTDNERRNGYVRILLPVITSVFAILVSLISTELALLLLVIVILLNFLPSHSKFVSWILKAT